MNGVWININNHGKRYSGNIKEAVKTVLGDTTGKVIPIN
jgi:hypothetical protein